MADFPAVFAPPPPAGGALGAYKGEAMPSVVQYRWNRSLVTDMVEIWPDRAFIAAIEAGAAAGAAKIREQYQGWGTGRLAADVETPKFMPVGMAHWTGFIGSNLPYAWMEDQGIGDKVIRTTKGKGLIPINAPRRGGMVGAGFRDFSGRLMKYHASSGHTIDSGNRGANRRGQYQNRTAIAWVREVRTHPAKNYLAAAEAVFLAVFDREMRAMYPG